MAQRLWENLGTLLISLILAVLVWVVALSEENPIEERTFATPLTVELLNMSQDMILVSPVVTRTTVTIRAPRLVWNRLTARQIHVSADLAGLAPGTHDLRLRAVLDEPTARITRLDPESITLTLESLDTVEFDVTVEASGTPARGYEADTPRPSMPTVTVTGPASAVATVSKIIARISLEGLKEDLTTEVTLIAADTGGRPVLRVALNPSTVKITVPITQKAGFRDVAVKVVYTGQVASGYQVTNITVAPSIITLSSADPTKVEQLPGFVETEPMDISGATDDIVRRLALALPEGVRAEGVQSVQVQVSIAAIEYSLRVVRPLEPQGLGPGLTAVTSPETVDILILGPLPVLDRITPENVRAVIDLEGLAPGTYQVAPQIILLSDELRAENIQPVQVEVTISVSTPTPSSEELLALTPAPRATPGP